MISYYECYEFSKYFPEAIPIVMDGNGNFIHFIQGQGDSVFISSAGNLCMEDSVKIAESIVEFLDDPINPEEYLFGTT